VSSRCRGARVLGASTFPLAGLSKRDGITFFPHIFTISQRNGIG
jgi:hypothetical protein